jgi:chorismate dehydratase
VVKLGVVPYLNVAPMIHGLEGDPRFELRAVVPSQLPGLLRDREVDLATIPSIEYVDEWTIVPGLSIASRGPVRSVCLFHREPLERVQTIALDASSRTSIALLRILLASRKLYPTTVVRAPGPAMLDEADAALVIGDPCLAWDDESVLRIDLGTAWTELTGLPFVWAFWAGWSEAVGEEHVAALQEALRRGRGAIPEIAARYNVRGPAGRASGGGVAVLTDQAARNEAYLSQNIVHALGEGEIRGLREFHRRAHALGLIPRVPELRVHGHT